MPDEKPATGSKSDITDEIKALALLDRVLINWVDAHTLALTGWVTSDFVLETDIHCFVKSLGYFICVKGEFLVLAMDVIHSDDPESENEYNSASAIPIACIKSIEVLDRG